MEARALALGSGQVPEPGEASGLGLELASERAQAQESASTPRMAAG